MSFEAARFALSKTPPAIRDAIPEIKVSIANKDSGKKCLVRAARNPTKAKAMVHRVKPKRP